jgi:hypothetical protein
MVGRHYLQLSAASYPEHRSGRGPMSGWGQKRRSGSRPVTSGLPLSTDIL